MRVIIESISFYTQLKYFGPLISSSGHKITEISSRAGQAKKSFLRMKSVLTNKYISPNTRKRIQKCYIEPIMTYGCKTLKISKQLQRKLEATKMQLLQRMLQISWTTEKSNEKLTRQDYW